MEVLKVRLIILLVSNCFHFNGFSDELLSVV